MWDLRMPSGLLFTILGTILCLMGLIFPDARAPLAETNVNLSSGVLFLVFGLVLLWMAKRAT
jgi:putative Ca2+/H+ antiporter (TMEM165/GDT1 family)